MAAGESKATALGPWWPYVACAPQRYYIGFSSNPPKRLLEHNRAPGFLAGPKATQSRAGQWVLELMVGPLHTHASAVDFKRQWRQNATADDPRDYAIGRAMQAADSLVLVARDAQGVKEINEAVIKKLASG